MRSLRINSAVNLCRYAKIPTISNPSMGLIRIAMRHNSSLSRPTVNSSQQNAASKSQIPQEAINRTIFKENPDLPSQKEQNRNQFTKKLEVYMDQLQETIFTATRAINDVTGYSSIEKLKKSIENQEHELKRAREQVKSNKELYTQAIANRSASQKEVNDLLQRKHNWTPPDLERFTNLYTEDHANERMEVAAAESLEKAETHEDEVQLKLTQSILTRYHEEQIWSDKIRRASTWGTFVIMGINFFLFVVVQLILEPWKRKRLVGSFEDKVKQAILELSEEQANKMDEMRESIKISNQEIDQGTMSPIRPSSQITFRVPHFNWDSFKESVVRNYDILVTQTSLQFDRMELGVLGGFTMSLGCLFGSLITYLLLNH